MARIRNIQLPPAFNEALVKMIPSLPEELVVSWGRECLPGGFTKHEAICERLAGRVRSEAALDPNLVKLLEMGLPFRELISAFSLTALQRLYPALSTLTSREAVLLAMLVDPCESVHQWAAEQALKPAEPAPTPQTAELAEFMVRDFMFQTVFDPLLIPCSEPDEDLEPPPADFLDKLEESAIGKLTKQVDSQKRQIERLQNDLRQQKERHQARHKEHTEAAEREKKRLRDQVAAAQGRGSEMEKEKNSLAAQLADLQRRFDALLAERLKEQTSAVVRKWLQEPLKVEAAAERAGGSDGDLVERAAQALEAQARQDRHTGNRLELERRLSQLQSSRQELIAAASSALVPVPEMKLILAELEHEIERLHRLLHRAPPESPLVPQLLAAINSANTWENVRDWSHLADQLESSGLLSTTQARPVYNAIQRKFSLLQELDRTRQEEGDSGWSLRDTIFRNKSALLLIDGHNLLYGLRDIFGRDYEDGAPRAKARARLVQVVSSLVKNRNNVRTRICFDGPDARIHTIAQNLEVIYSGGTGKNRVDQLIVAHLQFKELQHVDQKVFVVSDDREVRRGILRTGAKYVPANVFAVFLNDFKCFG